MARRLIIALKYTQLYIHQIFTTSLLMNSPLSFCNVKAYKLVEVAFAKRARIQVSQLNNLEK